jgi:CMP-N-acetylneuraminic acid synthetase
LIKPNVLAVIPARGGSKGIPKKNIVDLGGKPLIHHTIEAALRSQLLLRCVVSTDDSEIAELARAAGADVPFMRPAELSSDAALSLPVVLHALNHVEHLEVKKYDAVILLQPTAPFRTSEDIDACLHLLFDSGADSVVSVVDVCGYHPLRMKRIVADRLVNYVDQGFEDMRPRQSLPKVYIRNGSIYAIQRDALVNQNTLVGADARPYIMPADRSINIDNHIDLAVARTYFSEKNIS